MKKLGTLVFIFGIILASTVLTGCDDKKAQESITQLTTKLTESEKKTIALEGQVAKMDQQIEALKTHVSHLGDVVVNLQRLNESKGGKKAAAHAAKPSAKPAAKHATALPTKKKATKKHR